ncbi:hypothetical protein ACFSUS_13035 [Spirosoma soli]|uniref:Uncharacterized protein n=1 Tax=Spirosoma soli TaxID=1770529 RepID=A0ABW5M4Q9_9BACT
MVTIPVSSLGNGLFPARFISSVVHHRLLQQPPHLYNKSSFCILMIQQVQKTLIFFGLFLNLHKGVYAQDPSKYPNYPIHDVSLIQLVVTPEKYHGKVVQLKGYINFEFEGNAIYFHQEDYTHSLTRNGLWVDIPQKYEAVLKQYSKRYVIIIGTFDMDLKGHGELFSGGLKYIIRVNDWWPGKE